MPRPPGRRSIDAAGTMSKHAHRRSEYRRRVDTRHSRNIASAMDRLPGSAFGSKPGYGGTCLSSAAQAIGTPTAWEVASLVHLLSAAAGSSVVRIHHRSRFGLNGPVVRVV